MKTVVGIDGCKAGWFFFRKDQNSISSGIANNFEELASLVPLGSEIFIDIPIGLPDSGEGIRTCDKFARKALGRPRASSVFSAPPFSVLCSEDFEDAKQRSLQVIGKMISKQTFNIIPKIKEVNNYLISNPKVITREIHPEICFWGLNNRQAMIHSKKNVAGFKERVEVLKVFLPNAEEIIDKPLREHKRTAVSRDDILDALVALIVGSASDKKTMPPEPEIDSRGLRMEIVYAEKSSSIHSTLPFHRTR